MKKYIAGFLVLVMFLCNGSMVCAEGVKVEVSVPAAVLMELTTGKILYEKDADTRRSPASVTKVMTALLIMEALESRTIHLEDEVVTSAHAKSMGGSQVFLEEGEKQTVETLLKCIMIASGNDSAVAMAEYISGSEEAFVQKMNERAEKLQMKNTHFVDCCGLTDSEEHYTCPRDIAIMSRELLLNFPEIEKYTTIWMEDITHVTQKGSSQFGLTNTNKMLRSFDGCIGLKTGSTSKAGFCLSSAARRNGITMLGVVMAAPDAKTRFADAAVLLNYGFGISRLYTDTDTKQVPQVTVKRAETESLPCIYEKTFTYLDTEGNSLEGIEKKVEMRESLTAPVEKGTVAGTANYYLDKKQIGSVQILTAEEAGQADYLFYLKKAAGYAIFNLL